MKCKYCETENCSNYDAPKDYHAKCPLCSSAIKPDGTCMNTYSCPNGTGLLEEFEVKSVLSDAVIN